MKTIQNIFTLAAISSLGMVGCSSDRSAADYQTLSSEGAAADVNTSQTTAAIRRFQTQKGLSETGTLNQETIGALQIN